MQLSLILQCFQDIFIIYQFQIMLWNGPECLKNGLKKHMFRVRQNARLNSLKIHKKTTVYSTMTVHIVKYGTFVLWIQHIGMIITWSEKGKVQLSKDLSSACESFNSGNEINRKLKKLILLSKNLVSGHFAPKFQLATQGKLEAMFWRNLHNRFDIITQLTI